MQTHTWALGPDSTGCQRQLISQHFGPAKSGKVYIQASLHADEIPGMLVAQHLRQRLLQLERDHQINSEIVLVACANPVGLSQSLQGMPLGRFDLATGVNFNRAYRNLSAQLIETLGEQLGADVAANTALIRQTARQLLQQSPAKNAVADMKKTLQLLAIDADIVLDLHCDCEAVMHLYASTPFAKQAESLARWLGAQALLLATESGDDPFDESCGGLWWDLQAHFGDKVALACFATTVELRGQTEVNDSLAAQDANAILQFLAEQGHLQLPPQPQPAALCVGTPLQGVEALHAPCAGIAVFHRAPGDQIEVGDLIVELVDPQNGERTQVRASVAGKMFARTNWRHVLRGWDLAKIAGPTAFRTGNLLSM
ncbi:MAG: hypothetical protein RL748_4547 [Pseudomonadota bacterium]|jgi:predicted deacylase